MKKSKVKEVFRKVKQLKRIGYTVKPSTIVMQFEEVDDQGEVTKVRNVTWSEVKKQVKRIR